MQFVCKLALVGLLGTLLSGIGRAEEKAKRDDVPTRAQVERAKSDRLKALRENCQWILYKNRDTAGYSPFTWKAGPRGDSVAEFRPTAEIKARFEAALLHNQGAKHCILDADESDLQAVLTYLVSLKAEEAKKNIFWVVQEKFRNDKDAYKKLKEYWHTGGRNGIGSLKGALVRFQNHNKAAQLSIRVQSGAFIHEAFANAFTWVEAGKDYGGR